MPHTASAVLHTSSYRENPQLFPISTFRLDAPSLCPLSPFASPSYSLSRQPTDSPELPACVRLLPVPHPAHARERNRTLAFLQNIQPSNHLISNIIHQKVPMLDHIQIIILIFNRQIHHGIKQSLQNKSCVHLAHDTLFHKLPVVTILTFLILLHVHLNFKNDLHIFTYFPCESFPTPQREFPL